MISTRTTIGELGVLARMAPMLAMLEPTELRLYKSQHGDHPRHAQSEGYIQVTADGVMILVEEAHEPGSLDAGELRDKVAAAGAGARVGGRQHRGAPGRSAGQAPG